MTDRNTIVPIPVALEHPHDVARILEDEVVAQGAEQTVTEVGTPVPTPTLGILTVQPDGTPAWQPAAPIISVDTRERVRIITATAWTAPVSGLYFFNNAAFSQFGMWFPFPRCAALEAGAAYEVRPTFPGQATIILVAPL